MLKKIAILVPLLLLLGGGALFYFKGEDHYEPAKWSASTTDGMRVGSTIQFTLPDQHDTPISLNPDIQLLVIALDRKSGKTVRGFLDDQPDDFLTTQRALFLANISPIPVVIRNSLALPMLRRRPYSVVLMYEPSIADSMRGDVADQITVATLRDGRVLSVEHMTTKAQLKLALPKRSTKPSR